MNDDVFVELQQRIPVPSNSKHEKHWSCCVKVDGETVCTIERTCYSGVGNVEEYREQILAAADHLIAFIGREPSEFIVPEEAQ